MSASKDYAAEWSTDILPGQERLVSLVAHSCYRRLMHSCFLPDKHLAIEVGCGNGENTVRIARDFDLVTVIDLSEQFLEATRLRLGARGLDQGQVRYVHSAAEDVGEGEFPHPRGASAIFMMHILEHVENPVALLRKYKNHLRPKGLILISVPNADSIHRRLGEQLDMLKTRLTLSPQDKMLGHNRLYHPSLLRRHVSQAGLEYGPVLGSFLKPLSARQMNGWDDATLNGLVSVAESLPEIAADICVVAWDAGNQ